MAREGARPESRCARHDESSRNVRNRRPRRTGFHFTYPSTAAGRVTASHFPQRTHALAHTRLRMKTPRARAIRASAAETLYSTRARNEAKRAPTANPSKGGDAKLPV